MTGVDRRTFLKRAAAASAAGTAFSFLPTVGVVSELDRLPGQEARPTWRKAPCALCSVGCGLEVGVEDGRAVAARGDRDSPVSRGTACVKGYHSVQALYGGDRITRARVRRDGDLVQVPVGEALDVVADRLRRTVENHGKDAVALFGTGEWTIPSGYVASKLFKGGLGTNNVETDARFHSASAATGFRTSYGLDGPLGCYEDLDRADTFVLWNLNMAETHPVLFSRILKRRRDDPAVSIVELATRTTRTSHAADRSLLFSPGSELVLANAICRELVERERVDRGFLERHVAFKREDAPGERAGSTVPVPGEAAEVGWSDYVAFLRDYTSVRAERASGMDASDVGWLSSLYGDPSRNVVTLWGRQVHQHARGTWLNNLLHNLHLLTGKIAEPGNGPLPLPALASAAGTVWEAGAAADRLPGGPVVSEDARRQAAEIWGVAAEDLDPAPGRHAVSMFRALDEGAVRFMWIQGTNPAVELPDLDRNGAGLGRDDRFVVVSDAYPTATTEAADVVLPTSLWIEEEGILGNAGRRIQHFPRMLEPAGDAMDCGWQLVEVARRLGFGDLFPSDRDSFVEEIWEEYARFRDEDDLRLPSLAGLRRRPGELWPSVDGEGTKWRCNTAHDPAADPGRGRFDFYGQPDHRASIWLRPHVPPPEAPDDEFPFWLEVGRVLEHWPSASLTRRIPTLHRAVSRSYVEIHAEDAAERDIRDGDVVRLVSPRGTLGIEARIDYRGQPPRGMVFVPFFDETRRVNELTLDALCPVSAQPGYRCAVRLERMTEGAPPP